MDSIISYFHSQGLDIALFLKATGMLLTGLLALALMGRFAFGKRSALCLAVSSAIGILFIYAITVVCGTSGDELQRFVTPLPFISIEDDAMMLFTFQADYTIICSQVLSMIILSFLMNITDSWLPTGKHLISWVFFRCMGVVLALILHLIAGQLLSKYLPEGLVTYAPAVLLVLLLLMLVTGSLKIPVGLLLATVNPLIAALYTFFFANMIGRQITKAVYTTGILTAVVLLLQELGIFAINIAATALAAYIPLLVLLVLLWYLVGKLL